MFWPLHLNVSFRNAPAFIYVMGYAAVDVLVFYRGLFNTAELNGAISLICSF